MSLIRGKVYFNKGVNLPKITLLRRVSFTVCSKGSWDRHSLAVWVRPTIGVGIIEKPNKIFKYLMVGVDLFSLKVFVEFTYVGSSKKDVRLKLEDL